MHCTARQSDKEHLKLSGGYDHQVYDNAPLTTLLGILHPHAGQNSNLSFAKRLTVREATTGIASVRNPSKPHLMAGEQPGDIANSAFVKDLSVLMSTKRRLCVNPGAAHTERQQGPLFETLAGTQRLSCDASNDCQALHKVPSVVPNSNIPGTSTLRITRSGFFPAGTDPALGPVPAVSGSWDLVSKVVVLASSFGLNGCFDVILPCLFLMELQWPVGATVEVKDVSDNPTASFPDLCYAHTRLNLGAGTLPCVVRNTPDIAGSGYRPVQSLR